MKRIKKVIIDFFKPDKWYHREYLNDHDREMTGMVYFESGLKIYLRLVFVFLVIVALMIAASKIGAHYA